VPASSFAYPVFLLVDRDRAMVIAVIAMGMVQGSFVEIILMIPMGHKRMPTVLMPARAGDRSARSRILGIDLKRMLIVMSLVHGVKMTIMQIIRMIIMGQRNMPTMLSMSMGMLIVNGMAHMHIPFKAMNVLLPFQSIAQRTRKINYKSIIETLYH
jgi:hypothetical protein